VPSIEGLAVFLDKTAHIQSVYHKMLLTRQGYKDASDITSCDKPLNTLSDSDRAAIDKAHDILKQSGAQRCACDCREAKSPRLPGAV
jgi:hypothetical protein